MKLHLKDITDGYIVSETNRLSVREQYLNQFLHVFKINYTYKNIFYNCHTTCNEKI